MSYFSFIILTFNEEIHLPRLLESIKNLNVPIFVLDSGSTDATLSIAKKYKASIAYNKFENHPKQWDFALNNFNIQTEWIIGLDADQIVTPELQKKLLLFNESSISKDINGIYFNRKNYFRGQWIKYGGYFPKYLLKMFRKGYGHSDLNENMDHRFVVKGKTTVWKKGFLIEENTKENDISFWLSKHNKYSNLVAQEEVERIQKLRIQHNKPKFGGSPNERTAFLKNIWWKLPLYWRPCFYFIYRFFFQLGFLDGKEGRVFHFLQGFWFRIIVDIKIEEILKKNKKNTT